jgi:adenylate cyclase
MAKEIERKFLLATTDLSFLKAFPATTIVQGYLHESGMTSRVRIAGDQAFLTLKGKADGLVRDEYEYPIPRTDAEEILMKHAIGKLIYKTRYAIPAGAHTWEVDVFEGDLKGLVIAEIELAKANDEFDMPSWVGAEVSHNKAYTNKNLAHAKRKPLAIAIPQAA